MILISNVFSKINLITSSLAKGKIICFPTETVYSLSCDASISIAIKNIYEIKQRDLSNPLSVLMTDINQMKKYVILNDYALRLVERFSPGPITYILPALPGNKLSMISANNAIGVRIPAHPVAMFILKKYKFPLVGTSVNLSGKKPATHIEEVCAYSERIDLAVQDTDSVSGIASTVIDLTCEGQYKILRTGQITQSQIDSVL